jgi:hypothetical protein
MRTALARAELRWIGQRAPGERPRRCPAGFPSRRPLTLKALGSRQRGRSPWS